MPRQVAGLLVLALLFMQTAALSAQTVTPIPADVRAATEAESDRLAGTVEDIMARMSPADKVGQLFVVTFQGSDVSFESDIIELIHGYRIGGVVISPGHGNFSNAKGVDTSRAVATLANQLQAAAYGILLPSDKALDPVPLAPWPPRDFMQLSSLTGVPPTNLPLLIGVGQAGDDLPATSLRRGFTPLPSFMAIGASWNRDLATSVGEIVGRELHAVGVNLLLGPSLDVFNKADIEKVGQLGIYSFGGNPYWVSQLGRAYISGVHNGGQGRVATVAKHFPGQGDTDRLPSEEVATIQNSQAEMRQVALVPFLTVTRQPSSIITPDGDLASTDLIMTSHMRYSGLQGGGAGRIMPLSLAPELRTILSQEGFDSWRSTGGVVMSGALGSHAIRSFFAGTPEDIFPRRVAVDAFLAGNDLLFLADFGLDDQWEVQKDNIRETIGYFQDRYKNDPEFATQVDESVRRIIRLKLGLYRDALDPGASEGEPLLEGESLKPIIPLSNLLVTDSDLRVLSGESRANAEAQIGTVARNAVTILYPDPSTQTEPLPPSFQASDRILVFTDSRLQRECADCTAETAVGPDEIANIIKRLYGSEATGQIDADLVTSLTFVELTQFLDAHREVKQVQTGGVTNTVTATATLTRPVIAQTGVLTPSIVISPAEAPALDDDGVTPVSDAPIEDKYLKTKMLVDGANWIIFAMLNASPELAPGSDAVSRFLSEYSGELGEQKLVVLALNAPYSLDATEMSKLTTYFGVYSRVQPFLESAVRALFRSFTPVGAPPVLVPGTRFSNLAERLQPDPAQVIPLSAEESSSNTLLIDNRLEGEAGAVDERPTIDAGVTLRLRVGPILDYNGHPVPDGTAVNFRLQYEGAELALAVNPAFTRNGIATRDVTLERGGVLRLAATAGQATTGDALVISILAPPTQTPEPAATASPPANIAAAPLGDTAETGGARERANALTLLIALFTLVVAISLLLIVQIRILPRPTLVHNILWATIFGLAGYVLYALGLFPGGDWLSRSVGVWGTPVTVFVPMLLPLLWLQVRGEER
ncbi:MAG: hypothetical protein H3C34_09260 [Caldilineaceae bacterium]|nr:hypothetical protein [Caldilineaceae bacterium]